MYTGSVEDTVENAGDISLDVVGATTLLSADAGRAKMNAARPRNKRPPTALHRRTTATSTDTTSTNELTRTTTTVTTSATADEHDDRTADNDTAHDISVADSSAAATDDRTGCEMDDSITTDSATVELTEEVSCHSSYSPW